MGIPGQRWMVVMMEILGLMMQMRARRDDGQAEGWWMDGRW